MILLDTNIFIYLSNGRLAHEMIANTDIAHASITTIEALGYALLPANVVLLLEALFSQSAACQLTDTIVDRAVKLRQARRMSLVDAIIAATVMEHNLVLWTANIDDFRHIDELKLYNPLLAA